MPDVTKPVSLEESLENYLREKRGREQAARDAESRARQEQVRTLQGMLGPVVTAKCPHCGKTILDPRPVAPDDDYDTRA